MHIHKEHNEIIRFEPVTENDLPLLYQWFMQPYIAALWKEPTDWEEFREKFISKFDKIYPLIAYLDDKPVMYLQYYHVNDDDRAFFPGVVIREKAIGLDLFIGDPDYIGKGYGAYILREFISFVKQKEPECPLIIIDPAIDNVRAIACYEKVGFKIIGQFVTPYGPTGEGPGPILLMMYIF